MFKDVMGRQWIVELDGLTLERVRAEAKVDLADLSGTGYLKIETDAPALVAALEVICRDQIREKNLDTQTFAKGIRKDALTDAAAAVLAAAADFFPEKTWSGVLSRLSTERTMKMEKMAMAPLMNLLNEPTLPERVKDSIMLAIADDLQTKQRVIASASSPADVSVGGPTATPPQPAMSSPENVASTPAA